MIFLVSEKRSTADNRFTLKDEYVAEILNQNYEQQCAIVKEIIGYARTVTGDVTVPAKVKELIYFIGMQEVDRQVDKNKVPAQLFENLNLNKNIFYKWRFNFLRDYHLLTAQVSNNFLKIYRPGMKHGNLLQLILLLMWSSQRSCLVDIFGGTGCVTATTNNCFKERYFNELDSELFSMLDEIVKRPKAVVKECRQLLRKAVTNQLDFKQAGVDIDALHERYEKYYNLHIRNSTMLFKKFYRYLQNNEIGDNLYLAARKYILMSFRNQSPTRNFGIQGVDNNSMARFAKKINATNASCFQALNDNQPTDTSFLRLIKFSKKFSGTDIKNFSENFQNVDMKSMDFEVYYNYVADKFKNNFKDVIFYLDPPYLLTNQYSECFSDCQHRKLIEILKDISAKNGRWLFSCKNTFTPRELTKKYRRNGNNDKYIFENLKQYFEFLQSDKTLVKIIDRYMVATVKNIVPNHDLYVYKLDDEKYHEIVVANFKFDFEIFSMIKKYCLTDIKFPIFSCQNFADFLKDLPD